MKKTSTWLLLLYGLATRHGAARVNLWRKLRKFGAIQLKTSAYILPDEPVHYERFQWLAKQVLDDGGEATLIRAAEIEGLPNDRIGHLFNEARAVEYQALKEAIQAGIEQHKTSKDGLSGGDLEKHRRRFAEIKAIDYFDAPERRDAEIILQRMERILAPKAKASAAARLAPDKFAGKTWLTRPRPEIDRVGSSWLIRKFIDPNARFVFSADPSSFPEAIPYDMFEAEFSHHGDDCTFETLVKRFDLSGKTVVTMAEMIHESDLEDGKFGHTECVGIDRILKGWARLGLSDEQLLQKGWECFDALYEFLRR